MFNSFLYSLSGVVLDEHGHQCGCEGFRIGRNGDWSIRSHVTRRSDISFAVTTFHDDIVTMDDAEDQSGNLATVHSGPYEGINIPHVL